MYFGFLQSFRSHKLRSFKTDHKVSFRSASPPNQPSTFFFFFDNLFPSIYITNKTAWTPPVKERPGKKKKIILRKSLLHLMKIYYGKEIKTN